MTTTTNAIDYRERVLQEFNVSDEQLARAERWERSDGRAFYLIQSSRDELTWYRVEFNREHHCLQCLPHSGEACPASTRGLTCYHLRCALAAERIYRYNLAQERRREQVAIEAEASHRVEQAHADLEAAKLNAQAAKREAAATKRDGARAYSPRPFSLLK